jgi:hypothetical protein
MAALAACPGSVPVLGAACSAVSGAAGSVAGAGVDAVFAAAGTWVSSGAVWLIGEVGQALSSTTTVDLGTAWFGAHEAVMAGIAAAVVVPMVCCAAIQAVYRQSPSMLVRSFLVYLPLSVLLTGVAVTLVRLALAATDALSSQVMSSAGVDATNLFPGVSAYLGGGLAGPAAPAFVVFLAGLLVALAALVLWLELVVRAAAVSAAVLFLPLALAALVWPAVSHWCRRLADTLAALVLSKLVVAAVLSLGVGALAGGLGLSGPRSGGGFSAVVTGIALLAIATMAPFTLLRLVPAVEAGAAAHLESTRHRLQHAATPAARHVGNLAMERMASTGNEARGGPVGTGTRSGPGGSSASIAMITGSKRVDPAVRAEFRPAEEAAGAGAAGGARAGAAAPVGAGAGVGMGAVAGAGVAGVAAGARVAGRALGAAAGGSPDTPDGAGERGDSDARGRAGG